MEGKKNQQFISPRPLYRVLGAAKHNEMQMKTLSGTHTQTHTFATISFAACACVCVRVHHAHLLHPLEALAKHAHMQISSLSIYGRAGTVIARWLDIFCIVSKKFLTFDSFRL